MKRLILAAAFLALTVVAAEKTDSPMDKRADHWRQKLTRELPVGSSQAAILKWVSVNHLTALDDPKTNELTMVLERIPHPDSKTGVSSSVVVCSSWSILATFKLDAKNQLASTQVKTAGTCL